MEDWSVTLELGDPDAVLRPNQMILDYDKVRDLSLEVRTRRRGDRIAVYRDGRTRKLKDFMIDLKIPPAGAGNRSAALRGWRRGGSGDRTPDRGAL